MQNFFEMHNYLAKDDESFIKLTDIALEDDMIKAKNSILERAKNKNTLGIEGKVEIIFNNKNLITNSRFEALEIDLFWRDTVLEAIEMFLTENKAISYFPESNQKLILESVKNRQLISLSIEENKIENISDNEIAINYDNKIIKRAVLEKEQFFEVTLDAATALFNILSNLNLPKDNYLLELTKIKKIREELLPNHMAYSY